VYLKTLEITGFKSFPDKTVIAFGEGITSIVGPNGSGKSNISDAIRWVLGEQSTRTLRGNKMEDVIFAGTALRKGAGFAEVALTIDNTARILKIEYDLVTIARRYYRSGESDYFINKKLVRLKDVNELLMDTGLGRDGYSMIGQGRIDEVLSLKSTDRRDMFEEAAGISKFKYRKEEAERKLAATDENMVRVLDILSEVEGRCGPLEKKAEKARNFLLLRDELRGLEINLWVDSLRDMTERQNKTRRDFNLSAFALEEARLASEKAYRFAEESREAMREVSVKEEENRTGLQILEEEAAQVESRRSAVETEIRLTRESAERLESDLNAGSGRSSEIEESIQNRSQKASELEEEKKSIAEERQGCMKELEALRVSADESDARVLSLRTQALSLRSDAGEYRMAAAGKESQKRTLEERLTAIESDRARIIGAVDAQTEVVRGSEEDLQKIEKELTTLGNLEKGYRMRFQSRNTRAEELAERLNTAIQNRDKAVSRRNLLNDMQRDYEGFKQAVRAVMREKGRGTLPGVRGTVAELSRTEARFTLAIETALGGALQDIVVEDEETAKKGIRFLQRTNSGRATFRIMTAIHPYPFKEMGLEKEYGFLGIASELIKCEDQYEHIFRDLLGHTVICEDLDSAVALAKRRSYRFRIVTLDGQEVNRGGSLTGGSALRSQGILSRANELEELQEKIKICEGEIGKLSEEKKEADRSLDQVKYELETVEADLQKAREAGAEVGARTTAEKKLLETLTEQNARAEEEKEQIREALKTAEKERVSAVEQAEKLEKEASETEEQAEKQVRENAGAGDRSREITGKFNTLSENLAAKQAELDTIYHSLEELKRILESARMALQEQKDTLETYQNRIAEGRNTLEALVEELKTYDERRNAFREKQKELVQKRLGLEEKSNGFEKDAREKNEAIVELEKETQRLELRLTSLQEEEERLIKALWDQYELSLPEAEAIAGKERLTEKASVQTKVEELRRRIRALGEIDIGSIEEYQEIKTRFEELTAQKNDIEKSRKELTDMITEITGEMSAVFSEQFALLNDYFNQSFSDIFGGGSAELRMDDPSEVLTSGIEIVCKLPGKNLRSISLLSGGEKAFVAIALYFAILKLRPTPFCVLDEIEAALDDGNVVRFARYMRKLSDKTQFITITHRRGTMEESDILYGVTMQESGVSKLLIMDMSEIKNWDEDNARLNK